LDLLPSVEALLPSSKVFMQLEAVRPLADLLQLQSDALAAEVSVGANFLLKKLATDSSLDTATKEMLQFKDAFLNMYSLYAAALTIGVSTATAWVLIFSHSDYMDNVESSHTLAWSFDATSC